jgi:solute carrier family 40 (iron-regulated transporter), member 1
MTAMAAVCLFSAGLLLLYRASSRAHSGNWDGQQESLLSSDEDKKVSENLGSQESHAGTSSVLMCCVYFFAAWGDRMWEFSSVVFLLNLFPDTLLPPSLFGLIETIAGILGSSSIGAFIDRSNRLTAVRASIVGQNITIFGASILYYFALVSDWGTGTLWGVFAALATCACFAKWSSSLNKISIHKDWVVVMCGGDSALQSKVNANMRRVDLFCSILSPLAIGVIATTSSAAIACLFIAGWSFVSLFVEFYLSAWVYKKIPKMAIKVSKQVNAEEKADDRAPVAPTTISSVLRTYIAHPVFLASLGYCFLYVSVLNFGGIMVAFLKAKGLSDAWLAAGRGIAAWAGIVGTFATPPLIEKKGLYWAGSLFSVLQTMCLSPLAVAFFVMDLNSTLFMVVLFICICSSRVGLWGFDLVVTQLMQEEVKSEEAGAVNGAQEAFCNIGYLLSFITTMVFSNPSSFLYPALISFGSVISANVLFQIHIKRRNARLSKALIVEEDASVNGSGQQQYEPPKQED